MDKKDPKLTSFAKVTSFTLLVILAVIIYFVASKPDGIFKSLTTNGSQNNNTSYTLSTTQTTNNLTTSQSGSLPSINISENSQSILSTTSSTASNDNGATDQQTTKGTLTPASFDSLQNGLSYAEVTSIIGPPVKLVSQYGVKGTANRTASYLYRNDSQKLEAIVVYKANQLVEKMEISLGQNN